MNSFQSRRVVHEYTQMNPASPEKVFPLLCPVREADWIPTWRYNPIYSEAGVAELGCIFTTPDPTVEDLSYPFGSEGNQSESRASAAAVALCPVTTWMCVDYDPAAFRIAYVWVKPNRVAAHLRIQLSAHSDGQTWTYIRYCYTGLTTEGNHEVESYDRPWFEAKMRGWETAINHYLTTGNMIAP